MAPASVHDPSALRSVLEKVQVCASVLDKAYCDTTLNTAVSKISQPIESLFNWIDEDTLI